MNVEGRRHGWRCYLTPRISAVGGFENGTTVAGDKTDRAAAHHNAGELCTYSRGAHGPCDSTVRRPKDCSVITDCDDGGSIDSRYAEKIRGGSAHLRNPGLPAVVASFDDTACRSEKRCGWIRKCQAIDRTGDIVNRRSPRCASVCRSEYRTRRPGDQSCCRAGKSNCLKIG